MPELNNQNPSENPIAGETGVIEKGIKKLTNEFIYEVQEDQGKENLLSIVSTLLSKNDIELGNRARIRESIINNENRYHLDKIYPGDIIKISAQDNNSYELHLTKQGQKSLYVINVVNNTFQLLGEAKQEIYNNGSIIENNGKYNIKIGGAVLNLPIETKENAKRTIDLVNKILDIYNNSRNKGQNFYAAEDHQTKGDNDASINLHIDDKQYPGGILNPLTLWNTINPTTILFEEGFKKNIGRHLDATRDNNIMQTFSHFLNKIKDN